MYSKPGAILVLVNSSNNVYGQELECACPIYKVSPLHAGEQFTIYSCMKMECASIMSRCSRKKHDKTRLNSIVKQRKF